MSTIIHGAGGGGAYTSIVTAVAADVLLGKVIVDSSGNPLTGTIASKGVATITPGTANQTIAAGQYLSGVQTILGDADLVASNVRDLANIFGVVGTYGHFNTAVITASGNWTVPANVINGEIYVLLVGGGAGGASGSNKRGGGGGGGGHVTFARIAVTPSQVLAAVIGAKGTGGARINYSSVGNAGAAGGNTTFAGFTAKGGSGGLSGTTIGTGGAGGAGGGTGGSLAKGNAGATGLTGASAAVGGVGDGYPCIHPWTGAGFGIMCSGGGGGAGAGGMQPQTVIYQGGAGGSVGAGNGANGGGTGAEGTVPDSPGFPATFYGCGGGGGAGNDYNSWDGAGGDGYQGIVIIGYFTS